jgi:hypothetical protein
MKFADSEMEIEFKGFREILEKHLVKAMCSSGKSREYMHPQKRVQRFATVIFFGFVGQLGCWGLMIGGQSITTLNNALIIHAIGAPIVFGLLSYIYFKKLNYTSPRLTASTFVAIVVLLDFFIVALLINRSFDMFLSPIGTWIPFSLIFSSTYLIGKLLNNE